MIVPGEDSADDATQISGLLNRFIRQSFFITEKVVGRPAGELESRIAISARYKVIHSVVCRIKEPGRWPEQ